MLLIPCVLLTVAVLTNGQRRYYSLEDMPETNFDCRDKILGGYYADPEANCQMFHVCVKTPGQGVQDFRFLCPNETAFDQENQICADSGDIDCETSGLYLENFDLYRIGSAPAKRPVPQIGSSKGTVIPLGPSTKSPILTNNIYEDDDYYLQRSESGDRRLHSKDLLKGSSSSNFFNNRNKGKDLEDEDDDAPQRKSQNTNSQFQARQGSPLRPKTQYQSQFRKSEPQTQTQSSQQSAITNQNQLNEKKRTKIAVRKLTRKRPDEVDVKPTQQPQPQRFTSFTTQVSQKFGYNDPSARYNGLGRQTTISSTSETSEVFRQQQQPSPQPQVQTNRFSNVKKTETQTTPAFFEPTPTSGEVPKDAALKSDGNKDTSPFSLLRNPIVAAGSNYNPNQRTTNSQQSRPTTTAYSQTVSNGNVPFSSTNGNYQNQNFQQQQNRQNLGASNYKQQQQQQIGRSNAPLENSNFQQQEQPTRSGPSSTGSSGFQQPQQQDRSSSAAGTSTFQYAQNRQSTTVPSGVTNYQQQRNFQQNREQSTANNVNVQQQSQQSPSSKNFQQSRSQVSNGNYQQPQSRQPASTVSRNLQQQPRVQSQLSNGNYQQIRQQIPSANFQQTRQPLAGDELHRGQALQQNYNTHLNLNGQGIRQSAQRQTFNRNIEDFDDGENQEFLKTAPSTNFRPSDFNSFASTNYKSEVNNTRFGEPSTAKYITPTIVTTPKTTSDAILQTSRPNPSSTLQPFNQPSTFHSTTFPTTLRPLPQNQGSSSPARVSQPTYSSPSPVKVGATKDVAYDYAYYDDTGSFSEYDGFDHLGEPDFSRTSQRTKSRLI